MLSFCAGCEILSCKQSEIKFRIQFGKEEELEKWKQFDECTVTVKQFNVLLSKLDFVHFSLVSPQLFVEKNELKIINCSTVPVYSLFIVFIKHYTFSFHSHRRLWVLHSSMRPVPKVVLQENTGSTPSLPLVYGFTTPKVLQEN